MSISANLADLRKEIPQQVTLVAVSKFHPAEAIQEAYDAGQRIFGESKVQELTSKITHLPEDIQWHFIGHLQTNKVKYIAPFIDTIHSVDSLKLLIEIDKQAAKQNRVINVLLQMYIASEETKFGLSQEECITLLESQAYKECTNIKVRGLMGMASFTENESQVHKEFAELKSIFSQIKEQFFANDTSFDTISMGMSDDFGIAIEEGSTMVRVGSKIFGQRHY
ncbi:MAG: YggS family pyridoxal phosphate-dependent enzyme [Tannerellaceae bacterium]